MEGNSEETVEKKTVQITGFQYLVLKALLKAASEDISRMSITQVYYDRRRDWFVATDGHMLRIEKVAWVDEAPEDSFLLGRRDLMLTASQIKLKWGSEQHTKDLDEILLDLEFTPDNAYNTYPDYMAVMPRDEDRRPLEWVGMSPDLLSDIRKTFYVVPRSLFFQFAGELKGILLYEDLPGEERRLAGILMPTRVHGEKPEPLFELVDKKTGEVVPEKVAAPAV